MVLLCGLEPHRREAAKRYAIPMKEIEVLIDNALSENAFYQDKVISWEEYLSHRAEYYASKFVIGAKNRYKEIREEVLESGLFEKHNVVGTEEWEPENYGVVSTVNKMFQVIGTKVLYCCMVSGGYADLVVQVGKQAAK